MSCAFSIDCANKIIGVVIGHEDSDGKKKLKETDAIVLSVAIEILIDLAR